MLYRDILELPRDYVPCMDVDGINREPETWLNFYPHATFVDILRKLLQSMDGNGKSVWIRGAYGTGKSHASLVLQKLFMDDEARVDKWFRKYSELVPDVIRTSLLARRNERTLVIYDVNADNLDGQIQFLARLQKTISQTLKDSKYEIPLAGFQDQVLERIREDEPHFFAKRDEMQAQLANLRSDIRDTQDLEKELERQTEHDEYGLMNDIMAVLEARNIFLPLNASEFLQWIDKFLEINHLSRLVFIFDEFSGFVNRNRGDLTTFQELAQAAQQGKFFLVPVTHLSLEAFLGAGTDTSRKISNRFQFMHLDMPTNIAMKLAGHVLHVRQGMDEEWQKQRSELWQSVELMVNTWMLSKLPDTQADDFRKLLPLHPMSAVVLKQLASAIGANQRSLFAFYNSDTFRQFMNVGGIDVENHQYLTVDQLWDEFMAFSDPGTDRIISPIRGEYDRNQASLDDNEKRLFKAILLFILLEREHGSDASSLLNATEENIKWAFAGDGLLGPQVPILLEQLVRKRCLAIQNGRLVLFTDDGGGIEQIVAKWMDKFDELVLKRTSSGIPGADITSRIEHFLGNNSSNSRFDIRVNAMKWPSYSGNEKSSFADQGNKILLQFLFARDEAARVALPEKARNLASQHSGLRALFITAPNISFCQSDLDAWQKYVESWVRYSRADTASKATWLAELKHYDDLWWQRISGASLQIWQANPKGEILSHTISWENLKNSYLFNYIKQVFPANPDELSGGNLVALGPVRSLKNWALAGMKLDKREFSAPFSTVIEIWKKENITTDEQWLKANPGHPLVRLRDTCESFLRNTGDTGCSVCKLYKKLQKPPFGLINVPHTAMCLGFATAGWLAEGRGLQWSNGSTSQPLDSATLAEIIETAIKQDGERPKNEKQVYRLGPEEKAFIKAMGTLFGGISDEDRGVEGVLGLVPNQLLKISGRIPLWMLPLAMREEGLPNLDSLETVLNELSQALTISARGEMQRRAELVKHIGRTFREKPELVQELKNFLIPLNFERAFRLYVQQQRPELVKLSEELGDTYGQYNKELKNLLAEASSWLWKREDVDNALDNVHEGLKCCKLLAEISGVKFTAMQDAWTRLKEAVLENNHVPLLYWQEKYPGLRQLFGLLNGSLPLGAELRQLNEALTINSEAVRDVFFDPQYTMQLQAMAELFPGIWPAASNESRAAYDQLDPGLATLPIAEFKKRFLGKFDEKHKIQLLQKIVTEWKKGTESDRPADWIKNNNIPLEFALETDNIQLAENISNVLLNPDRFSTEQLAEVVAFFNEHGAPRDPDSARSAFLDHIAYSRHKNIILMAGADLTDWLRDKLDPDPQKWLSMPGLHDCLDRYVRENYSRTVQPRAVRKIRELNEAECKDIILELAQKMPDVGFYILDRQ